MTFATIFVFVFFVFNIQIFGIIFAHNFCENSQHSQTLWVKLYKCTELARMDNERGDLGKLMREIDAQEMVMDTVFPLAKNQNGQLEMISRSGAKQNSAQIHRSRSMNRFSSLKRLFSSCSSSAADVADDFEPKAKNLHLIQKNPKLRKKYLFLKQNSAKMKSDVPLFTALNNLRESVNASKGTFLLGKSADSPLQQNALQKQVINSSFLLADRMKIPRNQIVPQKSDRSKGTKGLLRELAKLWKNMKGKKGKTADDGKDQQNGEGNRNRRREERRRILQLITTLADDGNNLALNLAKNARNSQRVRRRRRKRFAELIAIIVAIVVLIGIFIWLFAKLFGGQSSSEEYRNWRNRHYSTHDDGSEEVYSTSSSAVDDEIKIKLRYDGSNSAIDHVYVIVGTKEYDYNNYGARGRDEDDSKKDELVESFSFDPPIYGDVHEAEKLLLNMANDAWGPDTHASEHHNCIDFVYQFVCLLHDDGCPEKHVWPDAFIEYDKSFSRKTKHRLSVFDSGYRKSRQNIELRRSTSADSASEPPPPFSDHFPTFYPPPNHFYPPPSNHYFPYYPRPSPPPPPTSYIFDGIGHDEHGWHGTIY